MRCVECGKRNMLPANRNPADELEDKHEVYFPETWWVRTSAYTWTEVQPYICINCGSVRIKLTGKSAASKSTKGRIGDEG